MKRALTIFMHYLDKLNPNLMVLCTTNYIENLDPAIVRRFSYKIKIANNSIEDMEKFLVNKDNRILEPQKIRAGESERLFRLKGGILNEKFKND